MDIGQVESLNTSVKLLLMMANEML